MKLKNISRRRFLERVAFSSPLVVLSSCFQRNRKYDLVIVGAGIAGMTCALRASEKGKRVLLIDGEESSQKSRTARSAGTFSAAAPGKEREYFAELVSLGWQKEHAKNYAENSWSCLNWYKKFGIDIFHVVNDRYFLSQNDSASFLSTLAKNKNQNLTIMRECEVVDFEWDRTLGAKSLSLSKNGTKTKMNLENIPLVLAYGGSFQKLFNLSDLFSRKAMIERETRQEAVVYPTTFMERGVPRLVAPHMIEDETASGFFINKKGERFCNEAKPLPETGKHPYIKKGEIFYYLLDKKALDSWIKKMPYYLNFWFLENSERLNLVKKGIENFPREIINGVLKLIKTPEVITEVDSFGRLQPRRELEKDQLVLFGPFQGLRMIDPNGLVVDGDFRLSQGPQKIRNIYCIGEASGGVFKSEQYKGGTSFGYAATSGFILGETFL